MNAFITRKPGKRSVALSLGLHAIAILLLALLAPTERPETPPLRLSASVQDEQASELQLFQPNVVAEPSFSEVEPNTEVPVAKFGQEQTQLHELASLLSGGAVGSHAVAVPSAITSPVITHRLFLAPITAAIDAAQHQGMTQAGCGSELRSKLRESVAYEMARIHPGQIFSVVFFPMGDLEPEVHLSASQEQNRQQLLDWVTSSLHSFAETRHVSTNPDLILIVSTHPFPMEELRNIVARCCPIVPVRVVGLKLDRGAAADLKSLASVAGGTYFGIE